jgi:hypothetical protein
MRSILTSASLSETADQISEMLDQQPVTVTVIDSGLELDVLFVDLFPQSLAFALFRLGSRISD